MAAMAQLLPWPKLRLLLLHRATVRLLQVSATIKSMIVSMMLYHVPWLGHHVVKDSSVWHITLQASGLLHNGTRCAFVVQASHVMLVMDMLVSSCRYLQDVSRI
jgi:hypothetical protein